MKRAIVLVGPKGAGKSTLGNLLENALGVRFVRVEPLFLEVRASLGATHPEYERRGSEAVLATELYDLATDTAQEDNLIADPQYGDLVVRLRAKFLQHNDHDDTTFDEPRTTPPVGVARK